jgi:hypothetical protein
LSIDWQGKQYEKIENLLERLNRIIKEYTRSSDLRRYDKRLDSFEATYLLDLSSVDDLDKLVDNIRKDFPEMGVTFLDQSQFSGI